MSDISMISAMFEEIKQLLKKLDTKMSKRETEQTDNANNLDKEDIAELKEIIYGSGDKIVSAMEDMKQSFRNEKCKVEHRISFDIKSSWVFVTMTGLVMLLIIALCLFYKQWEQNGRLKDNDLKYRYVLMKAGTTPDGLKWLEESFPDNRDSIQAKVLEYEDAVHKQAQAIVRKNLNDEEMKNLNEKIDKLTE
ncbi:MAG: hypothetical protein ACK5M3_17880 [Dysgonomonas sp.]